MLRVLLISSLAALGVTAEERAVDLPPAPGLSAGDPVENAKFASLTDSVDEGLKGAANHGVDMSTLLTKDAAACMADSYSFIIPRGYHSSGSVDTNVCDSIHHGDAAGIKTKDVYMFPCPTCSKSAGTQVQEVVDYLNTNCHDHWSKRLWLDIEGSSYWTGNSTKNKDFYEKLVNACKNKAPKCGVYSSSSQWSAIFGSSGYKYGNDLPLWYAHYDGNSNFDDFVSFGGWSSPHAKQFQGTVTACSTGVDKNYAPSF